MPADRNPRWTGTASRDKDGDPKRRHRLQDSLPLETSAAPDARRIAIDASHKNDKTANELDEKIKHSNPTAVPPQSFFQHDDRRTAARDGRRSGPGRTSERGWWNDSREERTTGRALDSDAKDKEEKPGAQRCDGHGWQHDKFSEADANQPAKRRRHFREEKLPQDSEPTVDSLDTAQKPMKDSQFHSTLENGRHEERHRERRPLERGEYHRSYGRERSYSNKGRIEKTGLPSRDSFNGSNLDQKYRGRDNFSRPQGYRSGGGRVDKWKHDMFVEEDPPKNEEDPVAKVEALLSL